MLAIRFVILATDGLWDYLPEQEAVEIVASCLPDRFRLFRFIPQCITDGGNIFS